MKNVSLFNKYNLINPLTINFLKNTNKITLSYQQVIQIFFLFKYLNKYTINFYLKSLNKKVLFLSLIKIISHDLLTLNIKNNLIYKFKFCNSNLKINSTKTIESNLTNLFNIYNIFKPFNSNYDKFGIIRIHTGFTNFNISFTTLNGKVISWINGGSDSTQSKRTRMTGRTVGLLMNKFLKNLNYKGKIRFIKVLFVGPSKRFRSKFFFSIKKRAKRLKFSIICKEEGFQRSFNGCRLTRSKR